VPASTAATPWRPARDVSLLEAVEAVEGPLVSRECVLRDLPCGADGNCVLHEAWSSAREVLRTVLAHTTLASATASPTRRTTAGPHRCRCTHRLLLTPPSEACPVAFSPDFRHLGNVNLAFTRVHVGGNQWAPHSLA
jgi:hypothetical protein